MAPIGPSEYRQKRPFATMGTSHKFSRGASSSYRHSADTGGDSEGPSSSHHVESEDSCTPKRKRISLSKDGGNVIDVPLNVFRISKLSASKRKDLESRFRAELKQTRLLRKELESWSTTSGDGVSLSSSRNGQEKKLGYSDASQYSFTALMKQCDSILDKLMKHRFGWVFNKPVDVVTLNIPDYLIIIKHPMDLGTIKKRISSGAYSSPLDFAADVRLTFTNAMTYNPPGNDFHFMADKLSKFFEPKWKLVEKKLALADSSVRRETELTKPVFQSRKGKASITQEEVKPKLLPSVKAELVHRLASMTDDMPALIIDFLRAHNDVVSEADEEEMEIDLDALSDDKFLELKVLLDSYMSDTQTKKQQQVKSKPLGVEFGREPVLSNSTMPPCEDEYVDIGGNDPLVSSYPPVIIEKEPEPQSNKCGSLSSGFSSSSDSDACSSAGSESDDEGTSHAKTAEGTVRADNARDQQVRNIMNPLDMNRSSSLLDKDYKDVHPKLIPVDEENAPSEGQVSPEKLYRAAFLRNRFADTILKAQEKTLDQVEKGDPEKLRRRREELEKKQRKEKARIQAEAKAAEDARKSKAAADAKSEREREREAARQALLKMEKTVEINENYPVLKDLELLRSVPGERERNSVDETIPDCYRDCMGGFKLCGSNPLEQLGLFMKRDDEEDEEAELRTAPTNYVEVMIN